MSTIKYINSIHPSGSTNNLVFDNAGNTTAGGTLAMSSSFMRNRIINGAMVIDQRNAGASVTPGDGGFTLDRWKWSLTQASKLSSQRSSTAPAGFVNSLLATSLSAYSVASGDTFGVYQPIEGFNVSDLGWGTANAQTVTVSFWVRASITGTYSLAVYNGAGNRSNATAYTINSANTWEYKTVTFVGDTSGTWATDNSVGPSFYWSLGTGSGTYGGATSGVWNAGLKVAVTGSTSVVGTNGATFYITGVQLEVGSVATPFEREIYSTTLAKCQRYYETTGSGAFNMVNPYAYGTNSTIRTPVIMYKVEKRTSSCTITVNDDNGNAGKVYRNGTNKTYSVWINQSFGFSIANSDTPSGTGDDFAFRWTSSAEL
jgi:hypothetical protein